MKMLLFFTEIGREKSKILIFYVIFLNKDPHKDISITVADIILRLCILVLHILSKRSVSQICRLGPSFNYM